MTYLCTVGLILVISPIHKSTMQTIYIAVKHVPREKPIIGLTIGEVASQIGAHRNNFKFNSEGISQVKGWLIYRMQVEKTKSALGRPGNLPQFKNND